MRRYKSALKERNLQVEGHRGFTAVIPQATVTEWERMCEAWDSAPYPKAGVVESPFFSKSASRLLVSRSFLPCHRSLDLSEAQARQLLNEDDRVNAVHGNALRHATAKSEFMALGLEIEDEQFVFITRFRLTDLIFYKRQSLKLLVKEKSARLDSEISEKRGALREKLRTWEGVREVYMPGLRQCLSESSGEVHEEEHPEEVKLWLPSVLPPAHAVAARVSGLIEIEDKLRTARCYDALESLRHILRIKARMVQFKNKNIRGQREGLRSTAVIDRMNLKARRMIEKYRRARAAKLALVGEGRWCEVLKLLADSDVRAYTDPNRRMRTGRKGTLEVDESHQPWRRGREINSTNDDDDSDDGDDVEEPDLMSETRAVRDGTGETRKTLSWIWLMEGVNIDEHIADSDDALRSEWAKSRARAKRATEEVHLLREEMSRALKFLEWKSKWWISRETSRVVTCLALAEGLQAYAQEQSHIQLNLLHSWRTVFSTPLSIVDDDSPTEEEEDDG